MECWPPSGGTTLPMWPLTRPTCLPVQFCALIQGVQPEPHDSNMPCSPVHRPSVTLSHVHAAGARAASTVDFTGLWPSCRCSTDPEAALQLGARLAGAPGLREPMVTGVPATGTSTRPTGEVRAAVRQRQLAQTDSGPSRRSLCCLRIKTVSRVTQRETNLATSK